MTAIILSALKQHHCSVSPIGNTPCFQENLASPKHDCAPLDVAPQVFALQELGGPKIDPLPTSRDTRLGQRHRIVALRTAAFATTLGTFLGRCRAQGLPLLDTYSIVVRKHHSSALKMSTQPSRSTLCNRHA